jgi:molybdopterin synthase sulfur carrier subunit
VIKVLFFARLRCDIGRDDISFELPESVASVGELTRHLIAHHPEWASVLDADNVLVAVNQTYANTLTEIQNGDEIAYFPPVTGG